MPVRTPGAAGENPPEGTDWIPGVIGGNVRAHRLLHRLEQEDLATRMKHLGHAWHRATVSEIERGRRNVTVPELVALVLALDGVTVSELIDPRGPGGRSGLRLALPVPIDDGWASVAAEFVIAFLCSHHVRTTVKWQDNKQLSKLSFTASTQAGSEGGVQP
jgi:transcriptional regulator with XRE-family HTH domain